LYPQGIICLDEVDKLGQPTAWMTYLRVEMFCLLDRRCPANLRWRPEDARLDEDSDEDARAKVEMRLEGQMLIVGAGAFQDLWDVQRDSVGFHAKRGISASSRTLTHKRMSEVIPVEILNRFVPPVLAMPRLQESDYLAILKALSRGLIVQERPRLRRLAQRSLAAACEQGLGSRWAEQLLLELVSQGRAVPKAVSASASKQEACSALPGEQQEAECALP
jgi:hypothetical protein